MFVERKKNKTKRGERVREKKREKQYYFQIDLEQTEMATENKTHLAETLEICPRRRGN